MSLNRKRRIFRPSAWSLTALPWQQLLLLCFALSAIIKGVIWYRSQPSPPSAAIPDLAQMTIDPTQVAVIDGGTLRARDQVIRLAGIAPPKRGEFCRAANGSDQDCGVAAANALAGMVADAPRIACRVAGHDPLGRALATCEARGSDLGHAMVLAGWARADQGGAALDSAEAQARAARRGVWGS